VVRVSLDCGFPLTALVTQQACLELGLREGDAVTVNVPPAAVQFVAPG
jgi:hypothetical protein